MRPKPIAIKNLKVGDRFRCKTKDALAASQTHQVKQQKDEYTEVYSFCDPAVTTHYQNSDLVFKVKP